MSAGSIISFIGLVLVFIRRSLFRFRFTVCPDSIFKRIRERFHIFEASWFMAAGITAHSTGRTAFGHLDDWGFWLSGLFEHRGYYCLDVGMGTVVGNSFEVGWSAAIALALAIGVQITSTCLYCVYDYGLWMLRRFPGPIFLDQNRQLRLSKNQAQKLVAQAISPLEISKLQLVEKRQKDDGGLALKVLVVAQTAQAKQGFYLDAQQLWSLRTDQWGRLLLCEAVEKIRYVRDEGRPAKPETLPILEGEVLLPVEI